MIGHSLWRMETCFRPSTQGAEIDIKTDLHTPKAVTYHEQSQYCRFTIGHSLGRMESRCRAILILYNVCWSVRFDRWLLGELCASWATCPMCYVICMEEHTCEAILPHINGNVARNGENWGHRGCTRMLRWLLGELCASMGTHWWRAEYPAKTILRRGRTEHGRFGMFPPTLSELSQRPGPIVFHTTPSVWATFQYFTVYVWKNTHVKRNYRI